MLRTFRWNSAGLFLFKQILKQVKKIIWDCIWKLKKSHSLSVEMEQNNVLFYSFVVSFIIFFCYCMFIIVFLIFVGVLLVSSLFLFSLSGGVRSWWWAKKFWDILYIILGLSIVSLFNSLKCIMFGQYKLVCILFWILFVFWK